MSSSKLKKKTFLDNNGEKLGIIQYNNTKKNKKNNQANKQSIVAHDDCIVV